MLGRRRPVWELLSLLLGFQLALAQVADHARRDDPSSSTITAAPTPTTTGNGDTTTSQGKGTGTSSFTSDSTASASSSSSASLISTTLSSIASVPTIGGGGAGSSGPTFSSTTVPAGQLPLQPSITPAWAVAGILLLISGAAYALVGIKIRWLHTFLSMVFLASLGTTILIVYVVNPPVSNAVQGGYLVAVVSTGLILGGAAIIFKELTECLGCLLGGFCLSMWLLTCQAGGLLTSTGPKVVFIAAFAIGSFALYFTRYTRNYALIVSISFAGATAATLGIDCFSRAGLKEFWAYIWKLNSSLFPLDTNTYPLTKGIRVELAVTIIICFISIISQLKLWKVVKARRAKREAVRREDERNLQVEEENIGRQIEETNALERAQWEATYGEGDERQQSSSLDSATGDEIDAEKRKRHSHATNVSRRKSEAQDNIEMTELEEKANTTTAGTPRSISESVMTKSQTGGAVTVRVAQEDQEPATPGLDGEPRSPDQTTPKVWVVEAEGEARLMQGPNRRTNSQRVSIAQTSLASPDIVPLPFKVPNAEEENAQDDGERSSVATFADEDDDRYAAGANHRDSLAKRGSQGSANLLRRLSQKSSKSKRSRVGSPLGSPLAGNSPSFLQGESTEELVIPRGADRAHENGDNGSVAATVDGMSSDDEAASMVDEAERRYSRPMELNAELAGDHEQKDKIAALKAASKQPSEERRASHRVSAVETISTSFLDLGVESTPRSAEPGATDGKGRERSEHGALDTAPDIDVGDSVSVADALGRKAESAASEDSTPVSLTKDRLPQALSRVALSYRTNEWAKHLSRAELPQPEALQLGWYRDDGTPWAKETEISAPVNVADLALTAQNGMPPPAAPRAGSAMAQHPASDQQQPSKPASRRSTLQILTGEVPPQGQTPQPGSPGSPRRNSMGSPTTSQPPGLQPRSASGTLLNRRVSSTAVLPIAEEGEGEPDEDGEDQSQEDGGSSGHNSAAPSPTMPLDRSASATSVNQTPVPGLPSFTTPQTLIGKRDMILRNKSQGSFIGGSAMDLPMAIPMAQSRTPSDAGSMYNYPMHGGSGVVLPPGVDVDDLPLAQRKEMMRQNSLMSINGMRGPGGMPMSTSAPMLAASAESIPFDSHQPKPRNVQPQMARDARLASFRQSVAADLRAGAAPLPATAGRDNPYMSGGGYGGYGGSAMSLLNVTGGGGFGPSTSSLDFRQSMDAQRSFLMSQKEAEAQRRHMERLEKETVDRAFEERMRRGDFMEVHREAMRKMQRGLNNS